MTNILCSDYFESSESLRTACARSARLVELNRIGIPVPSGFILSPAAFSEYLENKQQLNETLLTQITDCIGKLEANTGKTFGGKKSPLIVSIRSTAHFKTPTMPDTVLHIGFTEETAEALANESGNLRWAWNCYKTLIETYADCVMHIGRLPFDAITADVMQKRDVRTLSELTADDLKALVKRFKTEYKSICGEDFPEDPKTQLLHIVKAYFNAFAAYSKDYIDRIIDQTALCVEETMFGNLSNASGVGIVCTSDPFTDKKILMGEFLINGQFVDLVSGVRTPLSISEMKQFFPARYAELKKISEALESHYHETFWELEFIFDRNGICITYASPYPKKPIKET